MNSSKKFSKLAARFWYIPIILVVLACAVILVISVNNSTAAKKKNPVAKTVSSEVSASSESESTPPADTTPPVINGVKDITVTVGASFDPMSGITVSDDTDQNATISVDTGNFNINKAGSYTLTYTATDASGNTASATRKVTVAEKKPVTPKTTVTYTPPGGTYGWDAAGIANQPYLVAVNRAQCTVTVYGKDGDGNYTVPVKAMACSVGREGNLTPTGRFNTSTRYEWRLMVDGSYGRFAIRINGSIMFHSVCYFKNGDIGSLEYDEYNKLGSPASLGCVRLCLSDIKWLYDSCPNAFPVIIYDDLALSGPLGKPESIRIDTADEARRGWDPTDLDPNNPWNQ